MKVPRRGDIIFMDFDPQAGSEQQKRRPALVISATKFNRLGLAVVCPITSTDPRHGFHIPLPNGMKTKGCVMTEQIKSLDFEARDAEFHETAPMGLVQQVRSIINQFL